MSTTKMYDIRVLFHDINMGVTVSPLMEIDTVVMDLPKPCPYEYIYRQILIGLKEYFEWSRARCLLSERYQEARENGKREM